jgi:hypothetical protein
MMGDSSSTTVMPSARRFSRYCRHSSACPGQEPHIAGRTSSRIHGSCMMSSCKYIDS